ncbi:hypothetical protein IKO70_03640 [bacterium]|nr:hypothetical protein [bacterium]
MKKSIIVIAMLAVATTLFAENESMSCESDLGKCTYTVSNEYFTRECYCRDGREKISAPEEIGNMPKKEECELELADICSESGFICENNAGECHLEASGEYYCYCIGRKTQRGRDENVSAEGCTAVLEKECGTEIATPRFVCADSEILNACVSYERTLANSCLEPITDEELEAALDTPIIGAVGIEGEMAGIIAQCCENSILREKHQTFSECIETTESCANKECCEPCGLILDESEWMDGASEEDAANTEAPTTGTTPEDTADGDSEASATDSVAPAENKEESKSDGCSMLFI